MAAFISLNDPDRRSERFIRVDHICVVHHLKVGTPPTVTLTFLGGENLKITGAEADQFLAIFAKMMHGQITSQEPPPGA